MYQISKLDFNTQSQTLQIFFDSLEREAHILTKNPELLWQQLFNRLQWEGDQINELLSQALEKHNFINASAWVHITSPISESKSLRSTLTGHTDRVFRVAISPDGTWLATTSRDKLVKIWDAVTGLELASLEGHTDLVFDITISPDGLSLVSTSADNTTRIWDVASRRERAVLHGHTDFVSGVAISPDSSWFATCSEDGTVRIWDLATGIRQATYAFNYRLYDIAISPDGSWLVITGNSSRFVILDKSSEKARLKRIENLSSNISFAVISLDSSWIALGSTENDEGIVLIWDRNLEKVINTLKGHTKSITSIAISPDNKWLATSSLDGTVRIWDAQTGEELNCLIGHANSVTGVAISPDGSWLASTGGDYIKIWNKSVEKIQNIGHTGSIWDVAISPDGRWFVSSSSDGKVAKLETQTGKNIQTYNGPSTEYYGVSISPDGTWLVAGGGQGGEAIDLTPERTMKSCALISWDASTGTKQATYSGHSEKVLGVEISPDGTWMASVSADRTVRLWDTKRFLQRYALFGHKNAISSVTISPDGTYLATTSADGTVRIWDSFTGSQIKKINLKDEKSWGIAISPDGTWLAMGNNRLVKILDLQEGKLKSTINAHNDVIFSVAISPDGKLFATSGNDNQIKIWDARSNSLISKLVLNSCCRSIAFHPLEPGIICGDEGGGVHSSRILNLEYGSLIVTSSPHRNGLKIVCPNCNATILKPKSYLGCEFSCLSENCGRLLKVNPFVLKPHHWRSILRKQKITFLSIVFGFITLFLIFAVIHFGLKALLILIPIFITTLIIVLWGYFSGRVLDDFIPNFQIKDFIRKTSIFITKLSLRRKPPNRTNLTFPLLAGPINPKKSRYK